MLRLPPAALVAGCPAHTVESTGGGDPNEPIHTFKAYYYYNTVYSTYRLELINSAHDNFFALAIYHLQTARDSRSAVVEY